MNTLAERLKFARQIRGLSQSSLAKAVGVSQTAIQKIESGKAAQTTRLMDLAGALQVRPQWLANGEGEMSASASIPPEAEWGTVDGWDSNTPLPGDEVEVPFLKDIELACGDGSCTDSDYNEFKLRFSKSTLKKMGAQKEHVFCFSARGDSMEPVIPEGSTVAINTADKMIVDGKIYAINQDGWKRLKVLHRISPTKIRISSINTPGNEEVDLSDVEIIGRMFWMSALFR